MNELYAQHFEALARFYTMLCRDGEKGVDLAQETFLKALEALNSFREEGNIRIWLCQIAKNCFYSRLRREGRLHFTADEPTEATSAEPIEQITDRETARQIHSLFEALPEPQHGVFSLRVFGQLSFKQIAAAYGKTENWACVTYHRARRKIREQMEDDHE